MEHSAQQKQNHGIFSRIDHLLSNKLTFTKYRRLLIIPYIFSDNNRSIEQEVNRKQNYTSI